MPVKCIKYILKKDYYARGLRIVVGPVADDNLYQVLLNYEEGIYNIEETIKRLKTYLLSNQISFHTEKSLESIKYIETIKVGEENE